MTLQSQVDALKDGDYVRAVFKYQHGQASYEGSIREGVLKQAEIVGDYFQVTLRLQNGLPTPLLTSVTVIARPLPPEPESGSFALLADGFIIHRTDRFSTKRCWVPTDLQSCIKTWAEIYPQIKKMWDKDGNEVAL